VTTVTGTVPAVGFFGAFVTVNDVAETKLVFCGTPLTLTTLARL
jgi:hypothetical protein